MERKLTIAFVAALVLFAVGDTVWLALQVARGAGSEAWSYSVAIVFSALAAFLVYQRYLKPGPPQD